MVILGNYKDKYHTATITENKSVGLNLVTIAPDVREGSAKADRSV